MGVRVLVAFARLRVEPRRRHQTAADRLDLLYVLVARVVEQILEVAHQLVEHAQVLASALERLVVEVVVVGHLGEQHADVLVVLAVLGRLLEDVGDVLGNDVVQQPVGLLLLHEHVLAVLLRLHVAVQTQAVADLKLAVQEPDEEKQEQDVRDDLETELRVLVGHQPRRGRRKRRRHVTDDRHERDVVAVKDTDVGDEKHEKCESGDGREHGLHQRVQHREVAVVDERRQQQDAVERLAAGHRRKHVAREVRVHGDRGQTGDDRAEHVARVPVGEERHQVVERRRQSAAEENVEQGRRQEQELEDERQEDEYDPRSLQREAEEATDGDDEEER